MAIHLHSRGPRRLLALASAAVLTLALGACGDDDSGSDNPDPADQASGLIGKTFVSTSVEGYDLQPDTAIQLSFTAETLSASAGCNSLSAGWTDDAEVIAWVEPIASTQMACSPELEDQDAWLTATLTDGLNIVDGDADLNLEADGLEIALDEQ